MVRWALREKFATLAMVVVIICCRSSCSFFVHLWSLEESRYVIESACFACCDPSLSELLMRSSRFRCVVSCVSLINSLMESIRTISPRVFVGFLIVEMPWKALSKAVWMISLLLLYMSSAFGAGILKVSDAVTTLLLSLLQLCSQLCS